MAPSIAPVLVAGGGPTGLAAALTLLQNKIPVRIIDKEPQHRIGQRAGGIQPRTFEVFHLLRVHEAYQRAQTLHPVREYKPGTLEPVKSFPMTAHIDPTPSVPYSNPMNLGQPALEAILRSHLEKYGCQVELETELQSFEDNGERVLAKLLKKKDGKEISEIFEASYLIGADGARGVTRKQLGLSFLGETRDDVTSVIGDICMELDGLDRVHWHMFGDRSTNLLMLRPMDDISYDGFQFIVISKDYDSKQLIADEKLLFKCISEVIGHEINVRKVVFAAEYRPNIRMVDKFGIGRVFVAGDAAHVHSPTGGQGLNTSIQDSLNLAWKLSLVYKGLASATLLDSYTTERLPVVAEMLNITTGYLGRMTGTVEGAMKRETRMNMLGVNYRTSPMVLDEFTHAEPGTAYGVLEEGVLVAGDRAPDAPGLVIISSEGVTGAETRLFDVFSPTYHTVLVFSPSVASAMGVLEALERYPEGTVRTLVILARTAPLVMTSAAPRDLMVDRDGHAHQAYLAVEGATKVVVVRPDGVLGAAVHGADGVVSYFAKVLL